MPDTQTSFWLFSLLAMVFVWLVAWRPLFGLMAVCLLAPMTWLSMPVGPVNLHLYQAVLLATLVIAACYRILGTPAVARFRNVLMWPMLLLAGTVLLAHSRSPNFVVGSRWLLYIGVLFAGYAATVLCVRNGRDLKRLLTVLVSAALLVACLAFASWLFGPRGFGSRLTLHFGSVIGGAFDNPNALGNYLAVLVPFFAAIYLHGKQTGRTQWLLAIFVIAGGLSVFATYSRSSYVGLLAAAGFLLFFRPRRRAVVILVVLLVAAVVMAGVSERLLSLFQSGDLSNRLIKSEVATKMFLRSPWFGQGLGGFEYFAAASEQSALREHTALENQYLLMLSEGGVFMLCAFLVLVYVYVRRDLVAVYRRTREPLRRSLIIGCGASLVSMLMVGMGEGILFYPKINWLIGMMFALPTVLRRTLPRRAAASLPLPEAVPGPNAAVVGARR